MSWTQKNDSPVIVILGGGLSGSLLAYRILELQNPPKFVVVEPQENLCGNHTWSFHSSDIPTDSWEWVRPLIFRSWEQQEVRFQGYTRDWKQGYHSVTSSHLRKKLQEPVREPWLIHDEVVSFQSNQIELKSGLKLNAKVVFDARGMDSSLSIQCGYQKFLGLDLQLEKPHGLSHPVIMDAVCEQKRGYRFFYLLPWSSHDLLIEDTRYSTEPEVDVIEFENEIRAYCKRAHWKIHQIHRKEKGSLPIPYYKKKFSKNLQSLIPIGVRGGYFHWTTGYSFPYAVQVAQALACEFIENPSWTVQSLQDRLKPIQRSVYKQSRFLALLNRMLFLAAPATERWKIFHRFYQLPEDLIFRFYQGNLKLKDQARILIGKPPVPIGPALLSAFTVIQKK